MGILPKKKTRSVDNIVAGFSALVNELEAVSNLKKVDQESYRNQIDKLQSDLLDAEQEIDRANRVAINLKAIFDPTPTPVTKPQPLVPFTPDTGQQPANPKG